MVEMVIFLIIAGVAIGSAAMMLISANAIHSALFLVLNFACVAFFFVTLSAPFIALVQVAVYAGAIMVLFLFVIMMLGAEKISPASQGIRWVPRAAILLSLIFLVTVGLAVGSSEIDLTTPLAAQPQLRVLHAADAPPVDVYLNAQEAPTFTEVSFREVSDYVPLPAGEYSIAVFPAGADPGTEGAAILGQQTLEAGMYVTLVASGADGAYQLSPVVDDVSPVENNDVRLTLFNALPDEGPIDLVDRRNFPPEDDEILVGAVAYGEAGEFVLLSSSRDRALDVTLASVTEEVENDQGDVEERTVLGERLLTYRNLALDANTTNLLVVAPEPLTTGETRIAPIRVERLNFPLYGSPEWVGWMLFTEYMLPFQLVGVLLLVALMGAVVLSREHMVAEQQRRQIVRRPLVGPQSVIRTAADVESGRYEVGQEGSGDD